MRRIEIEHITRYVYSEPVSFLAHKLHVRPREGHDLRIESSSLNITPAYDIEWQRDVFGNSVATVIFREPAAELLIASKVVVEHYAEGVVPLALSDNALHYPFHYDPMEQIDVIPYQISVFPQDYTAVGEWMADVWHPGELVETVALLERINRKIVDSFGYVARTAPGVQAPKSTLKRGKGSCRDMATFFIEACRYCGLASRFVSGYLVSEEAVKDYATTHAWAEVYLPGAGWRGFDSTSGDLVGGAHIAVAVHRHPEAIPPVSGNFVGPRQIKSDMEVDVRVTMSA
jgi:transglutaminase-like putative cysteine protease